MLTAANFLCAEINVNSRITNVTVFMQNAQVFKKAPVRLPSGTSEIIFNDVSPYLNKNSIQTSGLGSFSILNTQYRYHMEAPTDKVEKISPAILQKIKRLEDSLFVSQLRINRNKKLLQAVKEEHDLLLAHPLISGRSTSDSLGLLVGTTAFMRKELQELAQLEYERSLERRKLTAHHAVLQKEINELRAFTRNKSIRPRGKYHHQVVVTVHSEAATTGTVKINYLVRQAGWSPQYDLKAVDHLSDISMVYKAKVYQRTGEDWNNVRMKISNANPAIGNTKPVLPVWFINYLRFTKKGNSRYYSEGLAKESISENVSTDDVKFAAKDESRMLHTYTNKVQNFSTVEFNISIGMSIKSDGKQHYLQLKNKKVKTNFRLYLVPKLSKDAFVVARLSGWEGMDLLTGPANIYYGNSFVGRTVVNPSVLNDTLEVSMGRDRSLYVERKKLKSHTKEKMLNNFKTYHAKYQISLKNKSKGKVELFIEDQIPVTRNQKIEITASEGKGKLNASNGLITWRVNLKGLERKTFEYDFTVKYPKEETIAL